MKMEFKKQIIILILGVILISSAFALSPDDNREKIITWEVKSRDYFGKYVNLNIIRIDDDTHIFQYSLNESFLFEIEMCSGNAQCLSKTKDKYLSEVSINDFSADVTKINKYPIKDKSAAVSLNISTLDLTKGGYFIVESSGKTGETLSLGFASITVTTVESGNDVGRYASIAVDTNDVVHITYMDTTNGDLRYCNNSGGWTCVIAESCGGDTCGQYSSIALDSNDIVHVSHSDATNTALRYCNNTEGWTCIAIETITDVGQHSSIAIDSNNDVHISYFNDTGNNLRYCNNTAGTWACANVDLCGGNNCGRMTSIAIDSNDIVHISHKDDTADDVRYCNNTEGWTCTIAESCGGDDCGHWSSIAVDSTNIIHITHHDGTNGDLRYCNTSAAGNSWVCMVVEDCGVNSCGRYSSIAIDSSDGAHIIHHNTTTDEIRWCNNSDGWSCMELTRGVGADPLTNGRAIAIKRGRLCDSASFSTEAHVSFYNGTGGDLLYVKMDIGVAPPPGAPDVAVNLGLPLNNSVLAAASIFFNATLTPTNANLTNATLFVWYTNGTLFNETVNTMDTTSNKTNWTVYNFTISNYDWNVLGCGIDETDNTNFNCSWGAANYTFTVHGINITGRFWENETIEGELELFSINLSIIGEEEFQISTGNLVYNGTDYSGTWEDLGGDNYRITRSLIIPSFSVPSNVSFYWSFLLEDTFESFTFNSSVENQTIRVFSIDNCSSYGVLLMNYSLFDEKTQDFLNGTLENTTMEIDLNIYPLGSSTAILNLSENYLGINPAQVCLQDPLLNKSEYRMDVVMRYESENTVAEFHNIQNYSLTNASLPQNINLYGLNRSQSQNFLITFKDSNFLPVDDALIDIQRNYVSEGVFKSVEIPKTDEYGQAVGHFDLDGVIYTIIVSKNRVILATFDNIAVVCQDLIIGDCRLNLNAVVSGSKFDYSYTHQKIKLYELIRRKTINTLLKIEFLIK